MKIGFVINFSKNDWLGGYNYYLHLINSLHKFAKKKCSPIIIFDTNERSRSNKELAKFNFIVCNYFSNSNKYLRIFNKLLIIFFGKSFLYEAFLKKNNIKIISHSLFVGKNSFAKSYPWFPDFQEYFYPNFFNKKKIILRKLNLYLATMHSEAIIVSSKSTAKNLRKISLKSYNKAKILFHTNPIINSSSIRSENYIKKKYKIKKDFYLLPNQYWAHKNHILVLKALKMIRSRTFQVISTGKKEDHRNPKHFNTLLEFVKKNKLELDYKFLGVVPENDFFSLINISLGVINPSKFEGWGNSGAKAISLGRPAILSDIGPHREFKEKAYFFNPENYQQLSKILMTLSKKRKKKQNYKFLYKKNENLTKRFIQNYIKIIS